MNHLHCKIFLLFWVSLLISSCDDDLERLHKQYNQKKEDILCQIDTTEFALNSLNYITSTLNYVDTIAIKKATSDLIQRNQTLKKSFIEIDSIQRARRHEGESRLITNAYLITIGIILGITSLIIISFLIWILCDAIYLWFSNSNKKSGPNDSENQSDAKTHNSTEVTEISYSDEYPYNSDFERYERFDPFSKHLK